MGKYTILDDSAADKAVQEVLDMVVEGVVDLMGEHVKAIVLMGGYGRGEGGVYRSDNSYKLANDLDMAVFVEKNFRRVKKEYNAALKQLSKDLQPKAKGIKQIDIDITNSLRFRFVPNLVCYYEIKKGNQVLYGDLNIDRIMPSLKAEKLPVFDGTIYFYSRGSGLLIPAIYFITDNMDREEVRENFQIEIQKACQAMGDALLLMAHRYHYSYKVRLHRFESLKMSNGLIPDQIFDKVAPLYKSGTKNKLNPSFKWMGSDAMVSRWFYVRDVFGEFFLWFESQRLGHTFPDWNVYSNFISQKGLLEPLDVRIRNLLKNVVQSKKIKCSIKTKQAMLLPTMPLILFSLDKDKSENKAYIKKACEKLEMSSAQCQKMDWLSLAKKYLSRFHPSGVVEKALNM